MKIQQVINRYGNLTGSELYVYDLSRKLVEMGHEVSIKPINVLNGELLNKTVAAGVGIGQFDHPDIVHSHQTEATKRALMYGAPIIQTVHSEVLPAYEKPLINKQIKKYIAIRDTVFSYVQSLGVDEKLIEFIPNGIDEFKFTPEPIYSTESVSTVLFAGPDDFLRKDAILDLVDQARRGQIKLILIGSGHNYNEENIVSFPPIFQIEEIVKRCDYTASVLMGRSTIEGWLCGKPGIIYDIDDVGAILNITTEDPPDDLSPYMLTTMVEKIERLYEDIVASS